jgi:hypothetical protein
MSLNRLIKLLSLSLLSSTAIAANNPAPLKIGVPGKKPGDIIAPLSDVQIAAWCDFNKQIITTKTGVLCVYVGEKNAEVTAENQSRLKELALKKKSPFIPKELSGNPYEMSEYGDEV